LAGTGADEMAALLAAELVALPGDTAGEALSRLPEFYFEKR